MLLEVKELSVSYDKALILNEISLKVDQGELVSLVGPNGAGKTTLLRAITGLVKWDQEILRGTRYGDIKVNGAVYFNDERIDGLSAHHIVKKGLGHCPERRRPFSEMTVAENLSAGAHLLREKEKIRSNMETVYRLFPILKERGKQVSGTLSGGEQQMLAIARALMSDPKLLCIDEPSIGLAPKVKQDLFDRIKELKDLGLTILLVEQDVNLSFSLSDRNYILSHGRIVAEGFSQDLIGDDTVRKSYLGL